MKSAHPEYDAAEAHAVATWGARVVGVNYKRRGVYEVRLDHGHAENAVVIFVSVKRDGESYVVTECPGP